jgi:type I restriction enzyme S subunit
MRRSKADEARESAAYARNKGEARAQNANAEGRVPRLRFPEYRQALAWVTNKLGTFVDEINDSNTDNENTVLTLSSENGLVIQEDYFNKRVASKDTCRYIPIKRNDFVYNDRSTTTSPFGTIKRLSKYDKGVVSPIYLAFRPRKAIDPAFLEYYFESGCHVPEMNQIVDQGARVGRFNLTPDKFFSINLYMPEKKEQQKIAACLSSLDDLITVHSRKLEALKKYKKGLMQQLFPAEGEKVPRLRFPEFVNVGAWEEKSLSQCILIISSGVSVNSYDSVATRQDIGVLKTSCVTNGKFIETENKKVRESEIARVQTNAKKNSIILSRMNTPLLVGESGYVAEEYPNLYLPDRLWMIECDESVSLTLFLSQCLLSEKTRMNLRQIATGSSASMKNISQSLFLEMRLSFPSLPEQEKIATFLSSLDDLIAAQAAKIDELKQHQRGLMQGLFPAPEEE